MEILELPAGSELDRVVAECVFGLKVYDYSKVIFNKTVRLTSEGRHLKEYSTDIAAAWGVVERFFNDSEYLGLELSVERMLDGWCCNIAGVEAMADTASLAICRAALKVLGSQE